MGTVIKAGSTGRLVRRFERLALKDHMSEARAVVHAARNRASNIIEAAEADAVGIREEGRQQGYESGFAEGRAAGEAAGHEEAYAQAQAEFRVEQDHLVSQLTSAVEAVESQQRDLLERAQHDVLAFAVMVAERITKRTGLADRQVATGNAAEAIRQVVGWTDLVIRVHPDDLEAMGKYAGELVEELTGQRHVRVAEDSSIEPGGCVVESEGVRVDATLREQFKEVVALLLGQHDQGVGGEDRGRGLNGGDGW